MATDRQISQLVLQVDANIAVAQRSLQDLARTVQQSTGQMNASLGANDNAIDRTMTQHAKLGLAFNNARIAQTELTAAVTRSIDAYGAGASPLRILTTEMGRLTEAASFLGGAAGGGVLGSMARFLGGPWGIAVALGVSVLAKLITAHKDEAETLDKAVEKLKKNREETELNDRAAAMYAGTLDGLIDRLTKLNEQTDKSLQIPQLTNVQNLSGMQAQVGLINREIDAAEADPKTSPDRLKKLYEALSKAVHQFYDDTIIAGEQEGQALADLSQRADQWAARQQNIIRTLTVGHPELAAYSGKLSAAFSSIKKAVSDAAAANVNFDPVTRHIDQLNNKLAESPAFIKDYIAQLKQLAVNLEDTAQKAKDAPKAIDDFKRAVVGAEGLGPNRLGSSAAGYGQFMPSTFESYFRKLYPQQAAGMTKEAIDDLRNNKEVATAVISAATDDYVKLLKAAGQQITEATLYTVHLLGAPDARKLFAASPGATLADVYGTRHANAIMAGNPFLGSTVSSAQSAIAGRIGDSSSAVSAGAAAIRQSIDAQAKSWAEILAKMQEVAAQGDKVNLLHQGGENLLEAQVHSVTTLKEAIERGVLPDLKAWDNEYATVIASQAELNRFGGQMIEDVLNPDNWTSWGDVAKRVLHDIEAELLQLAAINPLKNALFGSTLPTAGGLFAKLFGGGGIPSAGSAAGASFISDTLDLMGYASGYLGTVGGVGGTDNNILSINGQPRARVSADETLAIIPKSPRISIPANNNQGGGPIELVIATAPSDDAWAKVDSISAYRAGQAVQVSVKHTNNTIRTLRRPKISGG